MAEGADGRSAAGEVMKPVLVAQGVEVGEHFVQKGL